MTKSRGLREHHGLKETPTYRSWLAMKQRCLNPRHMAYPNYGGRGISICADWNKFSAFLSDMGHRPLGTSLDRIDNNKGYCIENCRWATRVDQNDNKRSNILVTLNGETLTLKDWAQRYGIKYATVHRRVTVCGWPIEQAITTPPVKDRKRPAWGAENGVTFHDQEQAA